MNYEAFYEFQVNHVDDDDDGDWNRDLVENANSNESLRVLCYHLEGMKKRSQNQTTVIHDFYKIVYWQDNVLPVSYGTSNHTSK